MAPGLAVIGITPQIADALSLFIKSALILEARTLYRRYKVDHSVNPGIDVDSRAVSTSNALVGTKILLVVVEPALFMVPVTEYLSVTRTRGAVKPNCLGTRTVSRTPPVCRLFLLARLPLRFVFLFLLSQKIRCGRLRPQGLVEVLRFYFPGLPDWPIYNNVH